MRKFILIILSIIIISGVFFLGYLIKPERITTVYVPTVQLPEGYGEVLYANPITLDEAIRYLEEARYAHYYWSNYTKPLPASEIGSRDFHLFWLKRYDHLITLLRNQLPKLTVIIPK